MCTCLSAVLLVRLVANATLGWNWADPAADLIITAVAVKDGRDAWQGDRCCAVSATVDPACSEGRGEQVEAKACGCGPGHACCL